MSRPLCQDWGCPAKVSCARHFGRSLAYAEMRLPGPPLYRGERAVDEESCADYERDKPREWMGGGLTVSVPGAAWGLGWIREDRP